MTDNAEPPELLSEPYGTRVTADQWALVLELTRKGIYRPSAIAKSIGRSEAIIRMRCTRDPEWGELYMQARAAGEMSLMDRIADEESSQWTRLAWLAERVHGMLSAKERADVENKKAATRQILAALDGPSEKPEPDPRFE